MQILSRCPLRVGSILWLPRAGAFALTVVCKATFRLAPELSPLADEQEPVIEADTYPGSDEGRGLLLATDLVPFKRQPEVLLVGHAHAPGGTHVGRLVARLTVVEVDKAIEVTGDRHFKLDGTLSHPARFAKMPLVWERAAGGPETSNPVGVPMGPEVRPDGWGRVPVPNLVPLNRLIAERDDIVPPACFAPIAPRWPTRVARLHRYGAAFPHGAWNTLPLPPDLDAGYFNAAPQDQQVHELLGSERITLENLHPEHPLLGTTLQGVKPRAHVDWGGGATFEIALACDTLLIDSDRGIACVTFRGAIAIDHPERAGWIVVTMDGHPAQAPSPAPSPAPAPAPGRVPPPEPRGHDPQAARSEPPVPEARPSAMARPAVPEALAGRPPVPEARPSAVERPPVPAPPGGRPPVPEARQGAVARPAVPAPPGGRPPVPAPPGRPPVPAPPAARAAVAVGADGLPAWVHQVHEVHETVAFDGDQAPAAALPFESGGDLAFAQTGDLDDAETFASEHSPPPAPVPPVVPKGPRLGAFRLVSPSDAPPAPAVPASGAAAARSDLDDAPTMDPDEAWLHETADDPSTGSGGGVPGVPAPPVPGAPLPPVPGAVAPPVPGAPLPPVPGAVAPPVPVAPPPPVPVAPPPPVRRAMSTTLPNASPIGGALPFAKPSGEAPRRAAAEVPDRSALPFAQGAAPVTPFAPGAAPATPFSQGAAPVMPLAPGAAPVMPFAPPGDGGGRTAAAQAPAFVAPAEAPRAPSGMTIGEMVAHARAPAAPPPFAAPPPSIEDEATMDAPPDEAQPPPPPAHLGPLATPAMVAADLGLREAPAEGEAVSAPAAGAPAAADAGAPAAQAASGAPEAGGPPPLPLDAYPVERCARIAASIARSRAPAEGGARTPQGGDAEGAKRPEGSRDRAAQILEAHELQEEVWEELKAHWAAEIKKETERGKTGLLRAYDAAFVAQLEDERGPIAVEEYARLVVASERGRTAQALAGLGLPEASMLRIQRVWMGKMQKDPELRRLVRAAVEAASED